MPKIIFRPNPTPPPFPPPTPPVIKPLTFTAKEDGCRIGYIYYSEDYEVQDAGLNIEYSLDGGQTWLPYTMSTDESSAQMINLDNGETVLFRGNNQNLAYYLEDEGEYQGTKFIVEGTIAASGDVSSLLNGIGGVLTAPAYCYAYMFNSCTSLTQAPALPATTLANACYTNMFYGCTLLSHIEALFTTTPGASYTNNWVNGVAQNGTFVKSSEATWDVSGVNGIPTGWTVTTN